MAFFDLLIPVHAYTEHMFFPVCCHRDLIAPNLINLTIIIAIGNRVLHIVYID